MDNTPNKAIERVVVALGGSKVVAPRLWPDKGVSEAQRLLCDCLNDDRPAKLDFGQVLYILRLAKERGIHEGMHFIADHVGYSQPEPIAKEDARAQAQREFVEAVEKLARMAADLQVPMPAGLQVVQGRASA